MTNFISTRGMFISIGLPQFYEKVDRLESEVSLIKSSVEKILEMNYEKNIKNINYLVQKSRSIVSKFEEMHTDSIQLSELKDRMKNLMQYSNHTEHELNEKGNITGKIDRNLDNVQSIKTDILKNIIKVDERKTNIILTLDKILFDNIVMMNSIVKNFELLLKN